MMWVALGPRRGSARSFGRPSLVVVGFVLVAFSGLCVACLGTEAFSSRLRRATARHHDPKRRQGAGSGSPSIPDTHDDDDDDGTGIAGKVAQRIRYWRDDDEDVISSQEEDVISSQIPAAHAVATATSSEGHHRLHSPPGLSRNGGVRGSSRLWNTSREAANGVGPRSRPGGRGRAGEERRYLLFDEDREGLNNRRIAWEMAGLIAHHSHRVLVLPPPQKVAHIDVNEEGSNATSEVEDFIHLPLLKKGLPTLTWREFLEREGGEYGRRLRDQPSTTGASSLRRLLLQTGGDASFDSSSAVVSWPDVAQVSKFKILKGSLGKICDLSSYTSAEKVVYIQSTDQARLFGCGAWAHLGEPKMWEDSKPTHVKKWQPTPAAFSLLRNHFVWHPDVFAVAERVVGHLGLFNYTSLHARYGDFRGNSFFKHSVPSAEASLSSLAPLATLAFSGSNSKQLYVATDETDPDYLQPYLQAGFKAVRWLDLLADGKQGVGPLAPVLKSMDPQRLAKISGPVEQLICSAGTVFVGTKLSTFSGYIQRLRIYLDAPVQRTLLFHTEQPSTETLQALELEQKAWARKGGADAFDRANVGAFGRYLPNDFPLDA